MHYALGSCRLGFCDCDGGSQSANGVVYSSMTQFYTNITILLGGSVSEWLACWTQARKGMGSNRSRDAVG